jgi:hypothetical protein
VSTLGGDGPIPVGLGGGGASLPVADPADLLSGATASRLVGTDVSGDGTLLTAAQAKALLYPVTADPMTGSGWTTAADAGCTAAWAASTLTLHADAGVTTSSTGSERSGLIPASEEYDIAARLDFVAGSGGGVPANVSLWAGRDSSNAVLVQAYADGNVGAGGFVGGSYFNLASRFAATSSGDRTGGDLWLRISRSRTGIAMYWGVGAGGAVPTSWSCIYASSAVSGAAPSPGALTSSQGTYARLDLYADASFGAALTVDVTAIRTVDQSGGSL